MPQKWRESSESSGGGALLPPAVVTGGAVPKVWWEWMERDEVVRSQFLEFITNNIPDTKLEKIREENIYLAVCVRSHIVVSYFDLRRMCESTIIFLQTVALRLKLMEIKSNGSFPGRLNISLVF